MKINIKAFIKQIRVVLNKLTHAIHMNREIAVGI